jgi:hypothetical protein
MKRLRFSDLVADHLETNSDAMNLCFFLKRAVVMKQGPQPLPDLADFLEQNILGPRSNGAGKDVLGRVDEVGPLKAHLHHAYLLNLGLAPYAAVTPRRRGDKPPVKLCLDLELWRSRLLGDRLRKSPCGVHS